MENEKGRKFVVPGNALGSEMEYLPGKGTFAEKDEIYSTLSGLVSDEARTLTVSQSTPLVALGIGTTIIGVIENIVEPIALVRVRVGAGGSRFGDNPDYAVLHASMIKRGYVKNVRDEYKIGDIIRAKIADVRNGEMRLATDADELGAIKAFCAKCRHAMKVENSALECESCGWKDNRKISNDYRKAHVE
jgi:exosome complex component CSL4